LKKSKVKKTLPTPHPYKFAQDSETIMNNQDDLAINSSNSAGMDESNSENLPQEVTESYGTGAQPVPRLEVHEGTKTHEGTMPSELAEYSLPSAGLTAADEDALWKQADALEDETVGGNPVLTAGDIDAAWQQAATVGDEAVGGTAPTPDQDTVEALGAAVGLDIPDREDVLVHDILESRDDGRWELDPMSSEDFEQRQVSEDFE
jgi:hypothetical protein